MIDGGLCVHVEVFKFAGQYSITVTQLVEQEMKILSKGIQYQTMIHFMSLLGTTLFLTGNRTNNPCFHTDKSVQLCERLMNADSQRPQVNVSGQGDAEGGLASVCQSVWG